MVDLDSNKLTHAKIDPEIPALPEPEGTILKNHLKQVSLILMANVAPFDYQSFILRTKFMILKQFFYHKKIRKFLKYLSNNKNIVN